MLRSAMDVIATHAAAKPDALALVEGERRWTWREFLISRNRLASALADLGVTAGEHVALYAHNSLEALLAVAATRALGAAPVMVNHRLVAEEVQYILDDSDAVAVFAGDAFLPVVERVRPATPGVRDWILLEGERRPWARPLDELLAGGRVDMPATPAGQGLGGSVIYTGGTTGRPKGAFRRGTDPAVTMAFMRALDMVHADHVHLVAGPLHHSAPSGFSLFSQLLGATVVVMRKFDAEQALALIERHRVTSTFMAPTLVKRLVDLPDAVRGRYDTSSLRVLVVAGAPCPMRVKEQAQAAFGPVLYEFYGSTELGLNTVLRPEDALRKPGSCGRAAPGVELALLDDDGRPVPAGQPGELYVRRYAGVFDGYWKNEAATRQTERGDWVSVGDVAWMDGEGFVHICDRKRDMIISGGVNIYPAEIEDVLHRHPGIEDAAVFGVPDDEWGERVHAAVQPRPGHTPDAEDIRAFARRHMADYKVPREVTFHPDFPRDTAGKLLKRQLRDPYWAGRPRQV
jgi:acyl-CoA synthetase (AMP-forming)/AMP-acid ligase II